ncbi:MAG: hypothetical protein K6E76_04385 [Patescibacteria group bacterium]|nr:hypothetical protein [Patescibacteria group bacterium]
MTKIETVDLSSKTTTPTESTSKTEEQLLQELQEKEKKKSDILYGIHLFEEMVNNFKESE